jgi:hypothetical protein
MPNLKEIEENQYKVDFEISKGYIDFSSELLRLSLLAMGGFGALVLIKIKGENHRDMPEFLVHPSIFIVSMILFTLCAGTTLFHRYYASDCLSWYIAWLRADKEGRGEDAKRERKGFHKMLWLSKWSLILSEFLFGGGVLFFIVAIFKLLS